ncbi:hypothetical protein P3S67_000354 [Capsicum chacoense]
MAKVCFATLFLVYVILIAIVGVCFAWKLQQKYATRVQIVIIIVIHLLGLLGAKMENVSVRDMKFVFKFLRIDYMKL